MKLTEIYPGLVALDFLDTEDNLCFWQVWLWDSIKAKDRWVELNRVWETKLIGSDAMHCGLSYTLDTEAEHIGHIHFVKDNWTAELVAHELMHAFIHYAVGNVPDLARIIYQGGRMEQEEDLICYPFGRWFDWVYRWLWRHNP